MEYPEMKWVRFGVYICPRQRAVSDERKGVCVDTTAYLAATMELIFIDIETRVQGRQDVVMNDLDMHRA